MAELPVAKLRVSSEEVPFRWIPSVQLGMLDGLRSVMLREEFWRLRAIAIELAETIRSGRMEMVEERAGEVR